MIAAMIQIMDDDPSTHPLIPKEILNHNGALIPMTSLGDRTGPDEIIIGALLIPTNNAFMNIRNAPVSDSRAATLGFSSVVIFPPQLVSGFRAPVLSGPAAIEPFGGACSRFMIIWIATQAATFKNAADNARNHPDDGCHVQKLFDFSHVETWPLESALPPQALAMSPG
jgi:hypothetical protein